MGTAIRQTPPALTAMTIKVSSDRKVAVTDEPGCWRRPWSCVASYTKWKDNNDALQSSRHMPDRFQREQIVSQGADFYSKIMGIAGTRIALV